MFSITILPEINLQKIMSTCCILTHYKDNFLKITLVMEYNLSTIWIIYEKLSA